MLEPKKIITIAKNEVMDLLINFIVLSVLNHLIKRLCVLALIITPNAAITVTIEVPP